MKNIKRIFTDGAILLAGIVISLMMLKKCSDTNHKYENAKGVINYKDTVAYYKAKSGKLVAYNTALEMDYNIAKDLIDSLEGTIKDLKLKKPSVIVRTVTVLRIDSVAVPFTVELPCDEFTLLTSIDSPYYKMNFKLTNKSLSVFDVSIPNTQSIVIGTKKNGLFKKDEYVATVLNSNPYMSTEKIAAIDFKPKKKFYDRLWFRALEIGAAFLIGQNM